MPFFGGGGGGDYKIVGTNIKGGNLAAPAIIGDNNMALGNASLQNAINTDKVVSIGNGALNTTDNSIQSVAIGYENSKSIVNMGYSVSIGDNTSINCISVDSSVLIGSETGACISPFTLVSNCVAIGRQITFGNGIGPNFGNGSISLGVGNTLASSCITLGIEANSNDVRCIVLGNDCFANNTDNVSIGHDNDPQGNCIVIGNDHNNVPANTINIGDSSHTSILIGGIDFSGGPGGGSTMVEGALSGTAVDIAVPSGTKKIVVMLDGISLSGTSQFMVQIGDTGGIENTGYSGTAFNGSANQTFSNGFNTFLFSANGVAANNYSAVYNINQLTSDRTKWQCNASHVNNSSAQYSTSISTKQLTDEITTLRIGSQNGSDTMDAGSYSVIFQS